MSNASNSNDVSYVSNESNASKPSNASKSSASVGRLSRYLSLWLEFLSYSYEQHSSDYHYDYVYDGDNGHRDDLPMEHRFQLRFNKQNYKILTDLIYFQISSKS